FPQAVRRLAPGQGARGGERRGDTILPAWPHGGTAAGARHGREEARIGRGVLPLGALRVHPERGSGVAELLATEGRHRARVVAPGRQALERRAVAALARPCEVEGATRRPVTRRGPRP